MAYKMLQIHRLENSGAMETQRVPSGPLSLPRDQLNCYILIVMTTRITHSELNVISSWHVEGFGKIWRIVV